MQGHCTPQGGRRCAFYCLLHGQYTVDCFQCFCIFWKSFWRATICLHKTVLAFDRCLPLTKEGPSTLPPEDCKQPDPPPFSPSLPMGICASSSPPQDLELPRSTAASSDTTSTAGLSDEPKTPTKSKQDAFAATKARTSEASPADVDLKVETSPAAAGEQALAARSEKLSPQTQKRKEAGQSSEAQVKKLMEAKKRLPFIFNRSFRDTDVKKDDEEEEKDVGGLGQGGPAKWSGSFMKVRGKSIQPKSKSGSGIGSEGFEGDEDQEASFFSAALSEMGTYGGLCVNRRRPDATLPEPRATHHRPLGVLSTALHSIHTTPRRSRLFNPPRTMHNAHAASEYVVHSAALYRVARLASPGFKGRRHTVLVTRGLPSHLFD